MGSNLFRLPLGLRIATWTIIAAWVVMALFPLVWLLVMAFKLPIDAFDANPLVVIFGPATTEMVGGISIASLLLGAGVIYLLLRVVRHRDAILRVEPGYEPSGPLQFAFYVAVTFATLAAFLLLVPLLSNAATSLLRGVPGLEVLVRPFIGFTTQHFRTVWIENAFYRQFLNTVFVTTGVVTISLTIGTLAGYGLARTRTAWAFWILLAALVFRALPHSTLVTGYLPPFIELGLYGKRIAVIIVLVAINQPFTIWMLRSFFMNIPAALDEAALVDGCNRLQAFWHVIMPIMWPGVITTGLFSFMLAYNDFLVSALLLDGQNQTMVPAIMQYFNRETTLTDQLEAIAAAVSITGPLLLLVLFFQKQIVSGLTQGAVKG